jgi:hypothetical protein
MSFVIFENVCHAASGHFMHCYKKNRIHLPKGPSPQWKITGPLGCTLSISLARWIFCSQLRYAPSLIQLSFGYRNFVKNQFYFLFFWVSEVIGRGFNCEKWGKIVKNARFLYLISVFSHKYKILINFFLSGL